MRELAAGNKAIVHDVFVFDALGPLTFEVERVVGGEHPGTSIDTRFDVAVDVVVFAVLGFGVVLDAIAGVSSEGGDGSGAPGRFRILLNCGSRI